MLLAEVAVGGGGGGATGQGDLAAVPLGQGQINGGGDGLGAAAGQGLTGLDHHQAWSRWIQGHGGPQSSHSVWKLPGLSTRS